MKITRAAEYAVRCVLYLAQKERDELVARQEVSERTDIPAKFLAKIAQDLAKAGFIEIRQGAKGGFRLIKPPKEISVLMVVETMIGKISLNDCVDNSRVCRASSNCVANLLWTKASNQLRETLAAENFAELAKHKSCFAPLKG